MSGPSPNPLSRRALLGLLGSAGVGTFVKLDRAEAEARTILPRNLACVARPEQTEGPYFVDGMLDRADIRSDPSDGDVKTGIPLRLRIVVHRVAEDVCEPLEGAQVDVWQCDADGLYSDVEDFQGRFDTRGKKFLRGHQTSGDDGAVEFVTIYPGWYQGRTPHIHFKVRRFDGEATTHEFTSQLYFHDALTDRVYAREPYSGNGARSPATNQGDGIFRGGGTGAQLVLDLVEDGDGFRTTFEMGLIIPRSASRR